MTGVNGDGQEEDGDEGVWGHLSDFLGYLGDLS